MKFTATFLPSKSNLSKWRRAFSASFRDAISMVAVSRDRFRRGSTSTSAKITSPKCEKISSKWSDVTLRVRLDTCKNACVSLSLPSPLFFTTSFVFSPAAASSSSCLLYTSPSPRDRG